MFGVAIAAICLTITRYVPPLGIVLSVIALLAWIRTVQGVARGRAVECPLDPSEVMSLFVMSTGVASAIVFLCGMAYVGVTLLSYAVISAGFASAGKLRYVEAIAFVPGILAAAVTANGLRKAIWPIRRR
jgi:hypothetical protein